MASSELTWKQIWGDGNIPTMFSRDPFLSSAVSPAPSIMNGSQVNLGSHTPSGYFPKKGPTEFVAEVTAADDAPKDVEDQKDSREFLERPLVLTSAFFVGLGLCLLVVLLGLSVSNVSYEYAIDKNPTRFALLAATPFLGLFGVFFVIVIFSDIFQIIGPINGVQTNSRFHSAIPPNIGQAEKAGFRGRQSRFRCQYTRRARMVSFVPQSRRWRKPSLTTNSVAAQQISSSTTTAYSSSQRMRHRNVSPSTTTTTSAGLPDQSTAWMASSVTESSRRHPT